MESIWAQTPRLLCTAGNFDRAGIHVLQGNGRIVTRGMYFVEGPDFTRRVLSLIRGGNGTLNDNPFDAALLAAQRADIVRPRGKLPDLFRRVMHESQTPEYVSAPLIVAGRPVGFVGFAGPHRAPLAPADLERGAALAELLAGALTIHLLRGRLERIHAVSANQLHAPGDGTPAERPLSEREQQVVDHAARGLTNAEIADALGISETTVKTHLSRAFRKLGARSRTEAAALAAPTRGREAI